ncbi:MAG TPA: hypothetical protein VM266_15940 [Solirubrobacteraceae bacterium]|nr:hypothetical protein [Solirubrobacteraceae bacterium]
MDGSIIELRAVEAGQPVVVPDSSGEVRRLNTGAVHSTYWFDTFGDDEPGGEPVEGTGRLIRVAAPHPRLEEDWCDMVRNPIG